MQGLFFVTKSLTAGYNWMSHGEITLPGAITMKTMLSMEATAKIWTTLFGITLLAAAGATISIAQDRALDDEQWRNDIAEVAAAIKEHHPRPFRTNSESEFDSAYETLLVDVPRLADKEVIVRLASLVGLVDDGHTRLSIPRQHPSIGLEFGHTPTPGPEITSLAFAQLPVTFEKFIDGIFVTGAAEQYAHLIGRKVIAVGRTPIESAFDAVQTTTFAENEQLASLMGVDRLTMPELLHALGISDSSAITVITLDGGQSVELEPLPIGAIEWVTAFSGSQRPLRTQNSDKKFWARYVPDPNIVYMQLNEIADGDIPLAQFVTDTLALAEQRDAKLVIDIRNNFGGSGGLNKTLVTLLIRSDELNQYDRTFVLTGRRTFSAAQMLVNELEQYTRVSFVGEPTGSRPDHFGDPKKIRRANSGLTLRVSRLLWSSFGAFVERDASCPVFGATWTSSDYFAGDDTALELAMSLIDIDLERLIRSALARGDLHQVGRYTLDSKRAPDTYGTDLSQLLLNLGNEYAAQDNTDAASLAYQVGLYFYPEHDELAAALEKITG